MNRAGQPRADWQKAHHWWCTTGVWMSCFFRMSNTRREAWMRLTPGAVRSSAIVASSSCECSDFTDETWQLTRILLFLNVCVRNTLRKSGIVADTPGRCAQRWRRRVQLVRIRRSGTGFQTQFGTFVCVFGFVWRCCSSCAAIAHLRRRQQPSIVASAQCLPSSMRSA